MNHPVYVTDCRLQNYIVMHRSASLSRNSPLCITSARLQFEHHVSYDIRASFVASSDTNTILTVSPGNMNALNTEWGYLESSKTWNCISERERGGRVDTYIYLLQVIRVQFEESATRGYILCIIHQGDLILYISKPISLTIRHRGLNLQKLPRQITLKICLQKQVKMKTSRNSAAVSQRNKIWNNKNKHYYVMYWIL